MRHDINGLHVVTEQREPWVAHCGNDQATGMTEQEAIQRLIDSQLKMRLRLMSGAKCVEEEWVSKRQLERFWIDIRDHAKRTRTSIVLDHPEGSIIHVFMTP